MSELKLRRLHEHNQRLMEDLNRPRMRVSEASARWVELTPWAVHELTVGASLIRYCRQSRDHLVSIVRVCVYAR